MERNQILTTLLALIMLLSVITVTYAYFIVGPSTSQNQTASVEAGTMSLTFADNDNGVGGALNFGGSITKKFTIENTGTLDAYAKLSWFNMTNTYLEGSLVYTLEFAESEDEYHRHYITDKNVPTNVTNAKVELADGLLVPAGKKLYYNLIITLVNSETVDQTADLNASFWTQFTLESGSSASLATLTALELQGSVKENPSYNMFDYTWAGYKYNAETGTTESYLGQGGCFYNGNIVLDGMTMEPSTKEYCNTVYILEDEEQSIYLNSQFESVSIYVGKSTWDSLSQSCSYNEVEVINIITGEPATEEECKMDTYYFDDIYIVGIKKATEMAKWVEISTTEGLYAMDDDFGTSYYFRGPKTLNNIVKFGTYEEDMYFYTFDTDSTYSNSNIYTIGNINECQTSSLNSEYECSDKYKFANSGDDIYWRIVRINGDGSLRLMYMGNNLTADGLQATIGISSNTWYGDDESTTGYTTNNSAPNMGDGKSSKFKNYLETWYKKVLISDDNKISKSQYFQDTLDITQDDGSLLSPTFSRLGSGLLQINAGGVQPTLKTRITTQTYGGIYNLKVGMLNADELTLSGFNGIGVNDGFVTPSDLLPYTGVSNIPSGLGTGKGVYTMTNVGYFGEENMYSHRVAAHDSEGFLSFTYSRQFNFLVPVINLTPEYARTLIGNGSSTNPYRDANDSL